MPLYYFQIEEQTRCGPYVNGDAAGRREKKIGSKKYAYQCAAMVKTNEPTANGMTWSTNGNCYAEFGATIIPRGSCSSCSSCIFSGRFKGYGITIGLLIK